MKVTEEEFEELVTEAISTLPEKFRERMENIAVVIENLPSRELLMEMKIKSPYGLLGLYRGIPYTRRGIWYRNVMPDKIIIFKKPIEVRCRNKEDIKESVRKVVIHEIGHYFGLGEADLRKIERERDKVMKPRKKEKIFLTQSYFKYPLPEGLLKELFEELKDINRYPSGGEYAKLRQVLAEYIGVKTENILPTNGSDELIEIITRTYKGEILIPIPTFSQYEISADRGRLSKILVNCLHDREYNINYSAEQLNKASLVWICNPNNPTGTEIPREKIIDILQRAKGMVVVDECNYEYLGETVVDLIDKYENLVISRSFSKNYGLAGLRLGFAISNPQSIKKLATFGQHFRVNRMAEKAAEKVLKYLDYYQEVWGKMKKVRDKFVRQINELGFSTYDSQANFVLVEFKDKKETERVWEHLKEKGIYTLAGWENEFSGLDDNFIRFTIGGEWEMDKVVEVLFDYVKRN